MNRKLQREFDLQKVMELRDKGHKIHEIAEILGYSKSKVGNLSQISDDARQLSQLREIADLKTKVQAEYAEKNETHFNKAMFDKRVAENKAVIQEAMNPVLKNNPPAVTQDNKHLNVMSMLPPGGGNPIVSPFQNYAGLRTAGRTFYYPSDQAMLQNVNNARAMWNDLCIREPLQSRLWAAAQQEGHVEPMDKNDPAQVEMAMKIQETIDNIPDLLKMKYSLLKSRFYGKMAVNVVWEWDKNKKLKAKKWIELNGDVLSFKLDDVDIFGVYVTNSTYTGAKSVSTEAGLQGPVHVFENNKELVYDKEGKAEYPIGANERDAVILMRYLPDTSDYLDIQRAGAIVGVGLRDVLYPTWYLKQEILGNMISWLERIGSGVVMYKFLRNNQQSYQAALTLAESQSNQAAVMVPVDYDTGGKPMEGIEIVQASAIGLDNFLRVIQEMFESQIRRMIVGQDATSQPMNTGLGSKIAEVQGSDTFGRIITFDCVDLEECLSHQLVKVIQKWNFPDTDDMPCRYKINYSRPNVDAMITAAKTLYDLGVELDGGELRSLCGLSKPNENSEIIKKSEGMGGFPEMPGEEPENPFAPQEEGEEEGQNNKDVQLQQLADQEKEMTSRKKADGEE